MTDATRVGFYVRNRFQVGHLRPLFRATPNGIWLVRKRGDVTAFGIKDDPHIARRWLIRNEMERMRAVVSHASVPGGKPLRRTPFIMVQYGYAKEPYNFGEWRKQAQAIMAYGPYAVDRFSQHAPAYAIGNPRWDDWNTRNFAAEARATLPTINPSKPVVVYAPTWGNLSSIPAWQEAVAKLAYTHNVLIKAHHNSMRDGQLKAITSMADVHDVGAFDLMQVLSLADVVISDYSGAIFDAILCDKPVVLLDLHGIESKFGSKLDCNSLEMARREDLGLRVSNPANLLAQVQAAQMLGSAVDPALKAALFTKPANVGAAFLSALDDITSL